MDDKSEGHGVTQYFCSVQQDVMHCDRPNDKGRVKRTPGKGSICCRNFTSAIALVLCLLLLAGCSSQKNVYASAGETVETALFDFCVDHAIIDANYGILTPTEGGQLVQMSLSVKNTGDETLTMFAQDFQIQWGDGKENFGSCLAAVDDTMVPYSYELDPGESYVGIMVVQVPEGVSELTIAYQEMLASGDKGSAYFVEIKL